MESRWRLFRHHLDVKLDQTQIDMIQAKLLTAVDVNPLGETPPQFLHSKSAQGVFWITCANESTKDWLMQTISGLGELWKGTELTVVDSKDLPKRPRVLVRIPHTSEVNTIMTRHKKQNPELNTSHWSVMSQKVTEKEQTLAFSTDSLLKPWLNLTLRPSGDWEAKKHPEAESTKVNLHHGVKESVAESYGDRCAAEGRHRRFLRGGSSHPPGVIDAKCNFFSPKTVCAW